MDAAVRFARRRNDIVAALGRLPQSGLHRGRDGRLYGYWLGDGTGPAPTWEQLLSGYSAAVKDAERPVGAQAGPPGR